MLTYKICVTGIVVFPQWQMTMRHWCWRIEYVSLALSSSFSAPLRVMSSSQCTSESGAFNSAPITLIHYSHSINTPVYRLFHQTILVVFLLYTPTLVSFLKSQIWAPIIINMVIMTQIIFWKYITIIPILARYSLIMLKPALMQRRYSLLIQSNIIWIIQAVFWNVRLFRR
jgi:hypothetical protein